MKMDRPVVGVLGMKTYWKQWLGSIGILLLHCSLLPAQESCPGEIKILLSPSSIPRVITTLGFEHKAAGQIYLFDTDDLALMNQGVILRVRQGRANDLTLKIRWSADRKDVDTTKLRQHFPCELDRTGEGEDISFSVARKYKPHQVPETGDDIANVLSSPQKRLLQEAKMSIDWPRVRNVASIKLTKWESEGTSSFGKLTLELWESPGGNILELSTRVAPGDGASKYAELLSFLHQKDLPLSGNQGTKTSMVLENLAHPEPALK